MSILDENFDIHEHDLVLPVERVETDGGFLHVYYDAKTKRSVDIRQVVDTCTGVDVDTSDLRIHFSSGQSIKYSIF